MPPPEIFITVDGKSVSLRECLFQEASEYVSDEIAKGCVPSSSDVKEQLEKWLEHYEEVNGEILTGEYNLERFVEAVVDELLIQDKIYQGGDKNSYIRLVRSRGLVSSREHIMMDLSVWHPFNFQNTEFAVDSNGRYIFN